MNNILYRIKFLFRKKGEFFASIEKIVGFTPRHIEYYRQALTHRSASVRDSKGHKADNERLEYLGDAVIETVISDILYHQYPKRDEGFLSTMRSKLVERKNLGRIAKEIGLLPLLRTDFKDGSRPATHNSYLGGNAFEALVGAIYLDRGFRGSFRFIRRLMDQGYIDIARTARVEENHKSLLLEWGQKYKADVVHKAELESKKTAFLEVLKDAGITKDTSVAKVLKYTDLDGEDFELDDKGKFKNAKAILKSVKDEWPEHITTDGTDGADVKHPPEHHDSSDFEKMSLADKMSYANAHPNDEAVKSWLGK